MMILLCFIVVALFMGAIGALVYYQIKKTDPNNYDSSTGNDISTTQDLLPFEDIKNGVLCMPNHKYRAYLEVNSLNYALKTKDERNLIEQSFQRFINQISFPIVFNIQTRTIDNTKLISDLKDEVSKTVKEYPLLKNYASQFLFDFSHIDQRIKNNKQKKKYIIVPYEDAGELGDLNDQEKFEASAEELYTRCLSVKEGLEGVGITSTILNEKEVCKLIYCSNHKDSSGEIDNIINKDYSTLVISGNNKLEKMSPMSKLDLLINEAENRIKASNIANGDMVIQSKIDKCLYDLENMRNAIKNDDFGNEEGMY